MGKKEKELRVYWDKKVEGMTKEELLEWIEGLPVDEETREKIKKDFGLGGDGEVEVVGEEREEIKI